ncbi:MAG: hypothetical protein HQ579_02610 [Candidatus Omnitrophica bacterium]|nr:hypothetical protein [Candidatus Omnitrophota bacterium]
MATGKKIVRVFAILLIIYAVISLLGSKNFNEFKQVCQGLPEPIIYLVYLFGIGYSIICIKCGLSIMRYEDWARKTAVVLVLISLILGALMTPLMLRNLKVVYAANPALKGADLDMLVRSTGILTLLFTFFELAFVFYFTRIRVKKLFK